MNVTEMLRPRPLTLTLRFKKDSLIKRSDGELYESRSMGLWSVGYLRRRCREWFCCGPVKLTLYRDGTSRPLDDDSCDLVDLADSEMNLIIWVDIMDRRERFAERLRNAWNWLRREYRLIIVWWSLAVVFAFLGWVGIKVRGVADHPIGSITIGQACIAFLGWMGLLSYIGWAKWYANKD